MASSAVLLDSTSSDLELKGQNQDRMTFILGKGLPSRLSCMLGVGWGGRFSV